MALSALGEEVAVPAPLDFDALDLPLWAPDWLHNGSAAPSRSGPVDGSVLDSRRIGGSLRTALSAGRAVPRVGIVVLEPVEHWQVDGADPFDQCERDLEAEAFEDQQRRDAGRLLYFAWPDEWLTLNAPDAAWRNRLPAYQLFGREAELGSAQAMPWHGFGVPLALVAFNAAWQPLFADRAAVVRAGGRHGAGRCWRSRSIRPTWCSSALPPVASARCGRRASSSCPSTWQKPRWPVRRSTRSVRSCACCRRPGCCRCRPSTCARASTASSRPRWTSLPRRCRWNSWTCCWRKAPGWRPSTCRYATG